VIAAGQLLDGGDLLPGCRLSPENTFALKEP
jgi:hypothetical protein